MTSTSLPPVAAAGRPTLTKLRFGDIAAHLREAIRVGHFPVGSLLPTELELCAHYDTSRHSIREALAELQSLGLVSRRKNVGTRVEAMQPTMAFRQSLASMDDLVQFGATHTRAVLQVTDVTASQSLAELLGCDEGSRWQRFTSLRLQGAAPSGTRSDRSVSQPIGLTEVYVPPGLTGLEGKVRAHPDVLISTLLETDFGLHIAEVTQDLCAVPLPAPVASRLGVEPASAGLRIVRRYATGDQRLVEISVTHHPAERFSMRSQLVRGAS